MTRVTADDAEETPTVTDLSKQRDQHEVPPLTGDAYVGMQADPQFQDLRRRFRRFVFPMTALFLVWYLLYVLLADYAHDFMATKVVGNINVGLVFGLLQFVSTFVITALYVRFADRHIDPAAEALRERLEREATGR